MKDRTWDVNGIHFFVSDDLIRVTNTANRSKIILYGAPEYAVKDLRNAALWLETMLKQIEMDQEPEAAT
jgi:hypothetical protein